MTRPAILGGEPACGDLEEGWPPRDDRIAGAVAAAMSSGDWGRYDPPVVERFANRFAERLGLPNSDHVAFTPSGRAAAALAMDALRIAAGDEVVLAAYDFESNVRAVLARKAIPVFVDCLPETGQLDPAQLADAITPATRAVLASGLHGGLPDLTAVRDICGPAGVAVVLDVCQLPFARWSGEPVERMVGITYGSFGGTKTLTAGRGGWVAADDPAIAGRFFTSGERGRQFSALPALSAAVLDAQLDDFDDRQGIRRRFVTDCEAERLPGFRWFSRPSAAEVDFYRWGFRGEFGELGRDTLCHALRAEGVPISLGYEFVPGRVSPRRSRVVGDCENARELSRAVLAVHHRLFYRDRAAERFAAAMRNVHEHAAEIAVHLAADA